MALGVRLLPPSAEDDAAAASVKFASKFEEQKGQESSNQSLLHLPRVIKHSFKEQTGPCRRNIQAEAASALMAGKVKPLMAERLFWKLKDSDADHGNTSSHPQRLLTS